MIEDKTLEKIAKNLGIKKEQVEEVLQAIKDQLGIDNLPEEQVDIMLSQLFS